MERTCRICRSAGPHPEWVVREMMYGTREEFLYFECSGCGCLQIGTIPRDLARHYPGEYYAPLHGSLYRKVKEAIRRPFRARRFASLLCGERGILPRLFPETVIPGHLISLMQRFGITTDAAVLDIGCGTGQFLRYLSSLGFHRLTGIDPFLTGDIALPRGVSLLRREVEELEGEFDLVLSTHSLEHIPDQDAAMGAVSRLLAPGGVAVVRIPTVSSLAWETYRLDWVQLDAPRHLYLHSRESFLLLANHHGLRVADLCDDSTEVQFWGSEQYRRDVPLNAPESYTVNHRTPLFSREEMAAFRRKAEVLNGEGRGDQFSAALVKSP